MVELAVYNYGIICTNYSNSDVTSRIGTVCIPSFQMEKQALSQGIIDHLILLFLPSKNVETTQRNAWLFCLIKRHCSATLVAALLRELLSEKELELYPLDPWCCVHLTL